MASEKSTGNGERRQAQEATATTAAVAEQEPNRLFRQAVDELETAVVQASGVPSYLLALGREADIETLEDEHGSQLTVLAGLAVEGVAALLLEDVEALQRAETLEEIEKLGAKTARDAELLDELADGCEAVANETAGAVWPSAASTASRALRGIAVEIEGAVEELHAAVTGRDHIETTTTGLAGHLGAVLDGLNSLSLPAEEREAVGPELAALKVRIRRLAGELAYRESDD